MKRSVKTFIAASLVSLVSGAAWAAGPVYSVNVVGFDKSSSDTGKFRIIANTFTGTSNDVNEVLAGQMTTGTVFTGDQIHIWEKVSGTYQTYFRDGVDGVWKDNGGIPATNILSSELGFWIQSRQAFSQQVVIVGDVIVDPAVTNTVGPGFQHVSYPYSAPIPLNSSTLTNAGAGTVFTGDQVHFFDVPSGTYQTFFLDVDRVWKDNGGTPAATILEPNLGFWFERRMPGTFDWVETKPYTYP